MRHTHAWYARRWRDAKTLRYTTQRGHFESACSRRRNLVFLSRLVSSRLLSRDRESRGYCSRGSRIDLTTSAKSRWPVLDRWKSRVGSMPFFKKLRRFSRHKSKSRKPLVLNFRLVCALECLTSNTGIAFTADPFVLSARLNAISYFKFEPSVITLITPFVTVRQLLARPVRAQGPKLAFISPILFLGLSRVAVYFFISFFKSHVYVNASRKSYFFPSD